MRADLQLRGFNLLEVVIGLGLFGVVIVALFTVIGGGLGMQSRAEVVELASSVARQQIEAIKEKPFEVTEGSFDGRLPTAMVGGFPPPPYPSLDRGRTFWTRVETRREGSRLWYLRVQVFSDEGEVTSMETYLKR